MLCARPRVLPGASLGLEVKPRRRGAYEIPGVHIMLMATRRKEPRRMPLYAELLGWVMVLVASFLALAIAHGLTQR